MRRSPLPYMSLAAAMMLAGSSVVAAKLMVAGRLPLFLSTGASLVLAAACLCALSWRRRRGLLQIGGRALFYLALQAFCGIFLFRVLLMLGLKRVSAGEAGIITSTLPAMTGLLAFLYLGERLSVIKLAGIAAAVGGLLILNPEGAGGGWSPAALPVLGAVFAEACFTVLRQKIGLHVSALAGTTWICCFGALCFLPPGIAEALRYDFSRINLPGLAYVAYYGLFATALAYILFMYGAARMPASTAGIFSGLVPLASVFLAHFLLGEGLTARHCLSLGLVLLGIAAGELPRPGKQRRGAAARAAAKTWPAQEEGASSWRRERLKVTEAGEHDPAQDL